jgi:hypothetical protein
MTSTSLLTWPTSDVRLDSAHGDNADLDEVRFNGLSGVPLVTSFGVKDNGVIVSSTNRQLHYNWNGDCTGTYDPTLSLAQETYIKSYDPLFFDGIHVKSHTFEIRLIDSPSHYTRFVRYFRAQNPTTPIGGYISATVCMKGATHPYVENYYPPSMVDAYRLQSRGPDTMGTPPHLPNCPLSPGRWLTNVAAPGVTRRFCAEVVRIVRETMPKPPFLFLDNGLYIQNEDWANGTVAIDCRDAGLALSPACLAYRSNLALEIGPDIYFDDLIRHYRALIAALEKEGVRSILNITAPAAALGYPREAAKYARQLERAIGTNGMAFEAPFHPNPRSVAPQTYHEIATHQHFLSQGKLVIFYADYEDIAASSWMAAMAMLIKDPGQSLFVSRKPEAAPSWFMWPSQYATPTAGAAFQQVNIGNPSVVGEHWTLSRTFQNGEITAGHLGVSRNGTFDLTQLVPNLMLPPYQLLYPLKFGTWNDASKAYTAGGAAGVDYLIFGAQPSNSGYYQKLIAISARVF